MEGAPNGHISKKMITLYCSLICLLGGSLSLRLSSFRCCRTAAANDQGGRFPDRYPADSGQELPELPSGRGGSGRFTFGLAARAVAGQHFGKNSGSRQVLGELVAAADYRPEWGEDAFERAAAIRRRNRFDSSVDRSGRQDAGVLSTDESRPVVKHWAYMKPLRPALPEVKDASWGPKCD